MAEVQQAHDAMPDAIGETGAAFVEAARQSDHPLVIIPLAEVGRREHWPFAELTEFLDAFDFTIEALEGGAADLCGGRSWIRFCMLHAGCVQFLPEAIARMSN